MTWFQRLFPVFILLLPVCSCLVVRTKSADDGAQPARGLMSALVWATVLLLALHLGVQSLLEATRPEQDALRASWPILISVLGSIMLWIRWAGPTLAAKNPAWGPPQAGPGFVACMKIAATVPSLSAASWRSAGLVSRHNSDPIGRRAWTLGWLLFGVFSLVAITAVAKGAPGLVLIVGVPFWLHVAVFDRGRFLKEALPRDAPVSAEFKGAYDSLGAFRCWAFYWLGLLGTLAFTCVAATILIWPAEAGMTSALWGSCVGIAGAFLAATASINNMRVNKGVPEAGA